MAQRVYEYRSPSPRTTMVGPWTPGLVVRIALTLVGAAGMVLGAFPNWTRGIRGVDLDVQALYRATFVPNRNLVATAGFVMIVLGLLAVVGLVPRTGWLTRLAGALGIVTFVLVMIELYRGSGTEVPRMGLWVSLAGSVVAMVGGFFGARYVVREAPMARVEPEEEVVARSSPTSSTTKS